MRQQHCGIPNQIMQGVSQLLGSSKILPLPGISLKIALLVYVNSDLFCRLRTKLLVPPVCFYCFKCAIYLCTVLIFVLLFMHVFSFVCYETVFYDLCMYVCRTINMLLCSLYYLSISNYVLLCYFCF